MAGNEVTSGRPNTINLMLVRHGQSTNNPLFEELHAEMDAGRISATELQQRWMKNRMEDPPLTPKGKGEAELLGRYIESAVMAQAAAGQKSESIVVYTSPFRRTLDTTAGLTASLKETATALQVRVHPDIYETGGVYKTAADGSRCGPGKCFTTAQIASKYPADWDLSLLPQEGQWYTGGWETDAESRARAIIVAEWLRSNDFRAKHANQTVIMVMHGHFIDHLQKALLGIVDDPSLDIEHANSLRSQQISFATPNTATSMFVVGGAMRGVIVRWINRIDHLGLSSAEALGKL